MAKIRIFIIMVDGQLHEVLSDPIDTEELVKHLISQGRSVSCTPKWVTVRSDLYAE